MILSAAVALSHSLVVLLVFFGPPFVVYLSVGAITDNAHLARGRTFPWGKINIFGARSPKTQSFSKPTVLLPPLQRPAQQPPLHLLRAAEASATAAFSLGGRGKAGDVAGVGTSFGSVRSFRSWCRASEGERHFSELAPLLFFKWKSEGRRVPFISSGKGKGNII